MSDAEDEIVKIDYTKMKNEEFLKWKTKLTNLIHSNTFCGLCLEQGDWTMHLDGRIQIVELGPLHDCSMIYVLEYLFGEQIQDLLASVLICEDCTDKAIQSYIFIHKTKKTSRILSTCVQNISENIDQTLKNQELEQYEKSIICLSLEGILGLDNIEEEEVVPEDFACTKCNRRFATQNGLTKHIELNHLEKPITQHERLSIIKCKDCDLVLLDRELEEHMKTHDVKSWFCSVCDKQYYSTACFEAHVKDVHNMNESDLATCDLCMKTFLTKESMSKHKCKYNCTECPTIPCVHHKYLVSYRNQKESGVTSVQCLDCEYTCTKKISMISHVNVDHLDKYDNLCLFCGTSFQCKPALIQHTLKYHSEMFPCEHCSITFGSLKKLKKHKLTCSTLPRSHVCDICSVTFEDETTLNTHKDNHLKPELKCTVCELTFSKECEFKEHEKTHLVTISCSMCTEDFNCRDAYKSHVETHPIGTKHMCRVCGASFNSKINHRKHIQWHGKSLEREKCVVCERYVNSSYLKNHMKKHTKMGINVLRKTIVKSYSCDMCKKNYATSNSLKRHKETHKEHVVCEICKKFVGPTAMKRHMATHGATRRLSCDKCSYTTVFPMCLEAHINRVHLKIRPFRCHICHKGYYAKPNLYGHIKTHNTSTDLKKKCEICGNFFANTQCLKKHMRLHTGEKPYPCSECDQSFSTASRRQEHVRRKHGVPKIRCPICNNLYFTPRDVRAHIKKTHCNIQKKDGQVFMVEELEPEHRYIFKDQRHPENVENFEEMDNVESTYAADIEIGE